MLILLLCELIATVLYLIGTFADESSAISILKNIGCSVIFLVIFVVTFLFVALEFKDGNNELENLIKVEVVVLFFTAIVILFSLIFKNEYYNSLFSAFNSLVSDFDITPIRRLVLQNILLFSVVGDLVVRYLSEYMFKREVRRTLEAESALAKEYAINVRTRMDEVRTIKHDIKNHITLLNMYYSKGQYDKLGEYLSELDSGIVEIKPLTYSKNQLIDFILMSYSEKFKSEGFEFTASAPVYDDLPIPDSELCSLVTNILSNALVGCMGSDKETGGFVRYKMTMTKSKIQIKCENSCDSRKNINPTQNVLETEKSNKSGSHGYGMGIIKNICEKHGGAILFSAEDGIFTLNAVLPLDIY
jgi:heme/copper-type cytochrome/quinol oxidase subunit 2